MPHFRRFLPAFLALLLCFSLTAARAEQDVPYIPSAQFQQLVVKAQNPVVLQFGADWCPYCRKVQPDLQDLAAQKAGNVDVYRINVDEEHDLATIYRVRTLPTFVYFVNGREVDRFNGAPEREELFGWVDGQAH